MKRIIILLLSGVLIVSGCSPQKEYAAIDGLTQGTTYHIVVESSPGTDIEALRVKIEALLNEVDKSLSIYNDSSVISLINSNISDKTDTLFREVFRSFSTDIGRVQWPLRYNRGSPGESLGLWS